MFVQFPGFSKIFYDALISIAKFEVWETGDTVADLFELNADEEPYNERFESFRYDTRNFLMNSGFILLMIISIFVLIGVSYLLRLLALICCNLVGKLKDKLHSMLYWGFVIRMMLEISLELSIISLMDIALKNWSNWGYVTSYCLSVIAMLSILSFALWIHFYLRKRELKDVAYRKKMGAAYDGLKAKPSSLGFTEWFIYRRIIYAAAAFFGYG